jgi:Ca2+-binding EF-hand superfamily protein
MKYYKMLRKSTIGRSKLGGRPGPKNDWSRKGLQTNDIESLKEIFKNFDLNNSGKINGPKLYQAFSALNMKKRSPEVFDIVCKIATIDHEIDEEEFITLIGETIGNTETLEGGEKIFDRLCSRKFISNKDEKRVPEQFKNKNDFDSDEEIDSEEERDVMYSETSLPKIRGTRLGDMYQRDFDDERNALFSMDTLGVIFEDLNRIMSIAEIENIFFSASDSENYITKEHFMTLYKDKVLNMGEEMKTPTKRRRH